MEDPDQYVFLTGLDRNGSNIANKTATGNVIFLDGTVDTVEINMEKSKSAAGGRLSTDSLKNTWCTYSVNSNGVYTLTEVANSEATFESANDGDKHNATKGYDKLGQSHTAGGTTAGEVKIDKKNIDLNGIANTDFKTVYGNNDSVYITAETTRLDNAWTSNGDIVPRAIVIDGADNVVTGIQNASLIAWNPATVLASDKDYTGVNAAYTSNGVYTLFKDNGYVIAAVVVGEDDGVTSHYAFVHSSSVKQEDWEAASAARAKNEDGIYTWYRDVILDGKEETLTEKTDSDPYLKKMVQGQWYEVKFNADGTVRKTARVFDVEGNWVSDARYIKDLKDVENAVKAKDTVVLYSNVIDTKDISYKGATLHIDTTVGQNITNTNAYAFPVAADANIVLLTAKAIDSVHTDDYAYTNSYTGAEGLEQAVNQLNQNSHFKGTISAVFESGLAKVVVIHDQTDTNIITGDNTSTGTDIGKYYSFTYQSAENGKFRATIVANRPEWLTDAASLSASFDIYVDGNKWDFDTITINNSTNTASKTITDTALSANPVVEIKNFQWTNLNQQTYVIKYYNWAGTRELTYGDPTADPTVDLIRRTGGTTYSYVSVLASGGNLKFATNDAVYASGTANYKVVNACDVSGNAIPNGTITTMGTAGAVTIASAKGGNGGLVEDFVKIYIDVDGLTPVAKTYSVKLGDSLSAAAKAAITLGSTAGSADAVSDVDMTCIGATNDTILLAVTDGASNAVADLKNTGVLAAGKTYDIEFKATMGNGTGNDDCTDFLSYTIAIGIDVGGKKQTITLNANNTDETPAKTIQVKDANVTVESIKITGAVKPLAIKSVSYDKNEGAYTVTFNQNIGKQDKTQLETSVVTVTDAAGATAVKTSFKHTVGTDYVIVYVNEELVAGDSIAISVSTAVYNYDDPAADAQRESLAANGTITFGAAGAAGADGTVTGSVGEGTADDLTYALS